MWEALVAVSGKLAELLKYREGRRDKRLQVLIDPLYADLQAIHKDYLHMLESVRKDLQTSKPLPDIAHQLVHDRLGNEDVRRAVVAKVGALIESEHLAEYREFFTYIDRYFDDPLGAAPSIATGMIDISRGRTDGKEDREFVERCAARVLFHIRRRWDEVSSEYARVLAASLK